LCAITGRQIISQNNLVKTPFDWINRSTFYRQILRFSEQKLGNLIPQCCRVSLRGNRRLSGFYFKNRALFHIRRAIKLVGVDLYAPLYRDEKRRAQEIEHFIRKLVEIERQAEEKKFSKKQDVEHYTEELSEGCGKLFQIIVKQGRIQLKRKAKVISYLINRMGKMILLTNDGQLKRDELLTLVP
jgi:rRNA-processing protein FCF1